MNKWSNPALDGRQLKTTLDDPYIDKLNTESFFNFIYLLKVIALGGLSTEKRLFILCIIRMYLTELAHSPV